MVEYHTITGKEIRQMTTAQIFMMVSIGMYLLMMLAIGYICSKQNNNADDCYQESVTPAGQL